ncbi:hypothetical protein [Paenibacillus larvae]|uniref:hypothetical protein n=1 Tax=Paenibacillus larvae TaxID=1464 RepID=UPI00289296DB|nr:hypothetical protein [Paenibacillus larvae]MDT2230683.1 hypothetical protein [Paenibacillus larvae]
MYYVIMIDDIPYMKEGCYIPTYETVDVVEKWARKLSTFGGYRNSKIEVTRATF